MSDVQAPAAFVARSPARTLIDRERSVLSEIAAGKPLGQVLDGLLRAVEEQAGFAMRTSVLFLSEDGLHLHHGAAPTLPKAYNEAIDGIRIGEGEGSCGTVASRGTAVYASDIADDPLWANYRDLALSHGLRACWSTPIQAIDGGLLGTFAIYYGMPCTPTQTDIDMIAAVTQTAALAIERYRSEAALRASEARLRMAIEAGRIGEWDYDLRTDASVRALRHDQIFGYREPVRDWGMKTFLSHVLPDDRDRTEAAFRRSVETGANWNFECRIRRDGDGEVRWITAHGAPQRDQKGRVVKLYGVVQDVTEQKTAEVALRGQNETLEQEAAERTAQLRLYGEIIQSSVTPICAFDAEYRLIAFNQAHSDEFFRIFGSRVRIGDVFPDLFPPEQGAVMRDFMARALRGEVYTVTERFGDPDLIVPYWEVSYSTLRDTEGRVIGAFHHARDISDRFRAEAELAATQDALRQSQKMEAVGQLTGGLAHDFNNLLTGISGSLDMLQKRVAQGRVHDLDRYLYAARGAAKRAAALTHRLLAFSRRQTLDPRPTDVHRLVAGMTDMIRRTVGPEVEVETVDMAGLWTALVDPSQLENALLNLCINARDAMPDGGRITIETANRWMDDRTARERDLPAGQYLSLSVSDSGTGMPPDVVARAFDPFFTTKPLGQGTGLGLSMIYGFARQSGGQVRIYSEVGEGTTVCVYLPRHYGEGDPSADEAEQIRKPAHALAGETVLVVDDEPTVRMLVADVLSDLGYTAIEAEDGPAGLRALQDAARVDLLVTDVGLPGGLNGRQVADAARKLRPGLKVLFITGYAENAALGNGHLDPGMEVMTKPFAMDDLAAKIRGLIEA